MRTLARVSIKHHDGRRVPYDKAANGSEASYMESWGDSVVAAHGETSRLAEALGVTAPPVRIDSMVGTGGAGMEPGWAGGG